MTEENAYEGHGGPPRGDSDEEDLMPRHFGDETGQAPSSAGMATGTGDPAGLNVENLRRQEEEEESRKS